MSTSSEPAPHVLVFGTGSIGATYGYILSKAIPASNILTVCRSNYSAAFEQGFTINSSIWGNNLTYHPTVVRTIADALPYGPFTYIIITSKITTSPPTTPSLIAPAVSPTTSIVLIQNGLNIEPPYTNAFPSNPILTATTYLPCTQTSPAVISHTSFELLNLGPYPSTAPKSHHDAAHSFANLIKTGGATAHVLPSMQRERYIKLLANASWNPISALSRSRDAQFLHSSPHALQYIRSVMHEIASVARAEGYEIDDQTIEDNLARSRGRSLPGVEPSMLNDVLGGREMEVEAILGEVVRVAEEKGVQVPLLSANYCLLKALDDSLRREREGKRGKEGGEGEEGSRGDARVVDQRDMLRYFRFIATERMHASILLRRKLS
jgi:2-dehydropantoate 2-reductase